VQDGRTDPANLAMLALAAKSGTFKSDVVAYPDLVMNEKNPLLTGPLMLRNYTGHFRPGGHPIMDMGMVVEIAGPDTPTRPGRAGHRPNGESR
jgi:hypothetical protein